ncbi:hypothetical protein ACFE04_009546 [Oxalis oulophora]
MPTDPGRGGSEIRLDVGRWASILDEEMNRANLNMSSECCIFPTPEILSRHNKKAYIPNGFAIGPYHHKKTQILEATEKIKLKYLNEILDRNSSSSSREIFLKKLGQAISEVEEQARKCYAAPVQFDSEKFVTMLVMDGCFIIELFRKEEYGVGDEENKESYDPIFTMSCLRQNLNHDLILLENQIPWFVLEILFDHTKIKDEKRPLDHLAIKFFENIFTSNLDIDKCGINWEDIRKEKSRHLLDLLRNFLICTSDQIDPKKSLEWLPLPSATTLSQLGVDFKKVNATSILDVQFNNGCLEIPSILLQETTETIFRNLVSLEQCAPNYRPRITSYVKLMVNLIDTKEDIKILSRNDIVDNWVNMEEATKIFNQLYTDTYVKEFHYAELCKKVDNFRKRIYPKARYQLCHNYCFNPWTTLGTIVVIFIFFLTILSAICDVKQAWIK